MNLDKTRRDFLRQMSAGVLLTPLLDEAVFPQTRLKYGVPLYQKFNTLFPLGSHLCRWPMPPMSEMKKDMENLKRHGFNLIKLQEQWAVNEPLEGRIEFSAYEELIAHAAKLEMGIYLGLTCEQAPAWLWRKYPDCRMVGRNGQVITYEAQGPLPSDGKPGPCFDHPGALAEQTRFIKELVRVLGAYENLVVWNTWQEIAYWSESIVGQPVCYCENTLAFFRRWLTEKYSDLDGLNRAWKSRYAEWRDVMPERQTGKSSLPQDVDWNYFMNNVQIAGVLRHRAQAIKEADPFKRPIFAHKSGPQIGSGVDWTYARTQDFLGSSSYPAWGIGHDWDDIRQKNNKPYERDKVMLEENWSLALNFDYVRSANQPGHRVWAAELQGGPVSTGLQKGRVPTAADIRRWMLTIVASGGTGISFWVTRAEIMAGETNGFSLLDSEGDSTERYEEAARVGQALNRHADLFGQPSWPQAEAAILINEDNYNVQAALPQGTSHLMYSTRGWHRLFWEKNIAVDFLESSQLGESSQLKYKALVLPFPLALSESLAAKLMSYVEQGGTLISETGPGRLTEHAFANRGELSPLSRRLFGVRQQSFSMVREPQNAARWSPSERTWGEFADEAVLEGTGILAGQRLRANAYLETFECDGSEPCFKIQDHVAGTVKTLGKGRAWLLGTLAGHNATANRDAFSLNALQAILKTCLVPQNEYQGQLLWRRRAIAGKQAWLFTNPTGKDIVEEIKIPAAHKVTDLFGAELARRNDRVTITVKGHDISAIILEV